jgi:hypothetical protein
MGTKAFTAEPREASREPREFWDLQIPGVGHGRGCIDEGPKLVSVGRLVAGEHHVGLVVEVE